MLTIRNATHDQFFAEVTEHARTLTPSALAEFRAAFVRTWGDAFLHLWDTWQEFLAAEGKNLISFP